MICSSARSDRGILFLWGWLGSLGTNQQAPRPIRIDLPYEQRKHALIGLCLAGPFHHLYGRSDGLSLKRVHGPDGTGVVGKSLERAHKIGAKRGQSCGDRVQPSAQVIIRRTSRFLGSPLRAYPDVLEASYSQRGESFLRLVE